MQFYILVLILREEKLNEIVEMINEFYRKKDEFTQRYQAAIILRRNQLLNDLQNFPIENAPTKFSCVVDDSDLQEIRSDAKQFGDEIKEPLKHAWQKCKIIEIYEQKGSVLSSSNSNAFIQ